MDVKPVACVRKGVISNAGCGEEVYLFDAKYADDNDELIFDQSAIDTLSAEVETLRAAMLRLLGWAEEIAGDNCDPEAAAEEIASVELARAAMQGDA